MQCSKLVSSNALIFFCRVSIQVFCMLQRITIYDVITGTYMSPSLHINFFFVIPNAQIFAYIGVENVGYESVVNDLLESHIQ